MPTKKDLGHMLDGWFAEGFENLCNIYVMATDDPATDHDEAMDNFRAGFVVLQGAYKRLTRFVDSLTEQWD